MSKPWPWFLALVRAFNATRELWVRLIGQKPSIVAYPGYGNEGHLRILGRAIYTGKKESQDLSRVRGWRSFLAVPVRNREINFSIGGNRYLLKSDEGGIIDQRVAISLPPGWHVGVLNMPGNPREIQCRVLVIADDTTFGVISDIDDTVMVTSLSQPLLAGWNTFVLEEHARDAVSGMPVLYERIRNKYPNSPIIYLSNGAWNIAPTLERFMARNLFPAGPLLLTDWGTTKERWFRSGRAHKGGNLESFVRDFPNIRWLLFGDDGEADPEIYHQFASKYPEHVHAIAIRKLGREPVLWEDGSATALPPPNSTAESIDVTSAVAAPAQITWLFAHDGSGLANQLKQLGIL